MKRLIKKINIILLLTLTACFVSFPHLFAENNIITIYYDRELSRIDKKVFGNNFIGYDTMTSENRTKKYYGYADYGAGIWDSKRSESVKEVIDLAKNAGISVVRFPGGCGTHRYNWKKAIGKERRHFLYGIDEFLKTVEEIGAEPVVTISYFTGNKQDAADLVEYLNAPYDGKHTWANKRAGNGHPEPYGVKYFEFGNEVWHGDHREIKSINPKEYAERYLAYQEAMKKVDVSIKLGAVLHPYKRWWDMVVLEGVRGKVDFVVKHIYPPRDVGLYRLYKDLEANALFKVVLGSTIIYSEASFLNTLKLIKEKTGKDDIYFAITEYNAGFVQNKPVPYRHSLGTALINAELLRIFMKPEHKILMANYWQFSNSYWGMIKSEDNFVKHDYRKPINYIKRPNYYVYELYNKHFGDVLVGAEVRSRSYDISSYRTYMEKFIQMTKSGVIIKKNLLEGNWKITNFPGVLSEEKNGVLEIDFKDPEKFNYFHSVKYVKVQADTYYKLSGYIKTEDLISDKGGVSLEALDGRGWRRTYSSASTKIIMGTADWQYVNVIYKTLPDAEFVKVIARRIGAEGPLKGKAFFKDVKFEKYIPPDTHIPYLSVNASKSKDGSKVYLMVINKNMNEPVTSLIELKNFLPSEKVAATLREVGAARFRADAWTLNGPSIDATNEKKWDNVKTVYKGLEIKGNPFEFTFEPHSLTAIEIERKE